MIDREHFPAIAQSALVALQSLNEFIRVQHSGRTPQLSDELRYEFLVRRDALRQLLINAGCFDQHRVTVYPLEGPAHAAMLILAAEVGADGDSLPPQIEASAARLTEVVRVLERLHPTPTGNFLKLSGDVWEVRFGEEVGNFQDRTDSALRRLVRLLAEPNRRFAALDLYPPPSSDARTLPHYGRDVSSDNQALAEYEGELRRLMQEIKEAEDAHDSDTANQLREAFERLTAHVDGEKAARKIGHRKRCGTLSPEEKADQALRVGLDRLKARFQNKGLPKLAAHLDKYLDNRSGEWWYTLPPGTSPWHITRPDSRPEK
jgi:hypothetical protein